ncbi:MAG: hypothetical protein PVI60_15045 [Desulfobacteraceae bacterium]|jgi:hypothetical protein
MGKNRENSNWQPISFLPKISNMIDGMLDASKETYEPLSQIKVHDDFTIKRIFEVTGQQIEDEWLYDKQLEKWSQQPGLKTAQRNEIQRLQGQMVELKKVNRKILAIAEEHKNTTIEKVLYKSDAEIGLDFLMGKLKL